MPDDDVFPIKEFGPAPRFDHIKNIHFGSATVPYVEDPPGDRPAGWVMPGGKWTTDRAQAMECAYAMDKVMRG